MANLTQIGDIQVFACIRQGATTEVYKGYQASLDRFVFLKVLNSELSKDPDYSEQFAEEARFIAKIQHPNVVTIFDYGEFEGVQYFAAEFIEGQTLEELIAEAALPPEVAWFILKEVAKGLQAAHDKGLLHKDIKPANVLISHEGHVKLSDFGMASLGKDRSVEETGARGTVGYFSPEQILGNEPGKYSDIFSLGVTFYEMLTGLKAFAGKSINDTFDAILNRDPAKYLQKKEDLPQELVDICRKMTAKVPAERYPDCTELLRDLQRFQADNHVRIDQDDLARYMESPETFSTGSPTVASGSAVVAASSSPEIGRKRTLSRKWVYGGALLAVALLAGSWTFFSQNGVTSSKMENVDAALLPSATDTVLTTTRVPEEEPERGQESVPERRAQQADEKTATPSPRAMLPESTQEAGVVKPTPEPVASPVVRDLPLVDSLVQQTPAPAAAEGRLVIKCHPWAYVFIDGDSLGRATAREFPLLAGEHEVLLKQPEFPPRRLTVTIRPDSVNVINFSFWSIVGRLMLEVSPWADVYIDDVYRDTVPPQKKPIILVPGTHRLTLKNPPLNVEWNSTVVISAGEEKALKFNLKTLLAK